MKFLSLAVGGILLLAGETVPLNAQASNPTLTARRATLDAKYQKLLGELATVAESKDLAAEAKIARTWMIPRRPDINYLFLPPGEEQPVPAGSASSAAQSWWQEFGSLRAFYAAQLFELAKAALDAHEPAVAYQLVHEVLRENPDHEGARKLLDFKRHNGRWARPAVRQKMTPGGWLIESEHYSITSPNLDEGKKLAARLEELHSVWRQLFAGYWFTEAELSRRFAGEPSRFAEPKHKVQLFASKDDYVRHLARDVPGIEQSLGYYSEKAKTAFFYAGDERTLETWFHEATHQLFHERRPKATPAGLDANFWIVEAIALYMESLVKHDGYYTAGGFEADRMQFARYRALSERWQMPLGELVTLSRDGWQKHPEVRRLYSQAAGLAHFLMDGEGGKHRAALVEYLTAVYRDAADAATLAKKLRVSYEELDGRYLAFLDVNDDALHALGPAPKVARLALGHTHITDAGLAKLKSLPNLVWLDVSFTKATDKGLTPLSNAPLLDQLSLEGTGATDAALAQLEKALELKELDLSRCVISDAGLAHVAKLKNLEILWLTGTQISDAGLTHLHGLKKLRFLDTDGSRVTPAGWAELKRHVPSVSKEQ